jgi:hypothetical protein
MSPQPLAERIVACVLRTAMLLAGCPDLAAVRELDIVRNPCEDTR